MTRTAPPHFQNLGETAEQELYRLIVKKLRDCGCEAVIRPGYDNSRENGEYGDCLISSSPEEMEIVTLELKGSSHPLSFSLSDYEKRTSVAKWVIIKGTKGIWAVPMSIAREHLSEMDGDGKKYWISHPPFSSHVRIDDVIDDIRRTLGELK